MSKTAQAAVKIILLFITLLFFSCTSLDNQSLTGRRPLVNKSSASESVLKIEKRYSILTLKKSLVQFHEILNSRDYFDQFTWGDYLFEDYLTVISGLENGSFEKGQGSEISVYDNTGEVIETVKRSVIDINGKEEVWWQTEHIQAGGETVFYETLTNRFSVPVTVRFRNAETGKAFSRDTMFGDSIRDAMMSMTDEEIQAKLDDERLEDTINKLLPVYENIENAGIEIIEAAGKKLEAVHFQSAVEADGSGKLDVWYSPEIPQGIVRITMNEAVIAEISGWIRGAERQITEESPDKLPVYSTGNIQENPGPGSVRRYSEGTVSEPVKLIIDEVWEGSVEQMGVSYYFFEVPYRGDIICSVSGFTELAELYNYGNDYTYSRWITGSEGGALDFQTPAAEKGDLIYFTVNDLEDSLSRGEKYFIDITVKPLLDASGILMMNNFRDNPEILTKGKNRVKISGDDIIYFVYEKMENGDAEIQLENYDSEKERFSFIDVDLSSYISSGEFDKDGGEKVLIVKGLEKGAKLYFYLVREEGLKNKKINLIVK